MHLVVMLPCRPARKGAEMLCDSVYLFWGEDTISQSLVINITNALLHHLYIHDVSDSKVASSGAKKELVIA